MNRRDFLKSIAAAGAGLQGGTEDWAGPSVPRGAEGAHLVYDFKGTPFEIGFQHGRALRDPIVKEAGRALEGLAKARGTSPEKALDYVVAASEPLFRKHAPMALEEIEGLGRGSGLGYPYAFFAATRDGLRAGPPERTACTAVTCGRSTTAEGKIFIGQNKDTDSELDRYRIMRLAYASGRRMIVLNYAGWIANIGMTSDGVAFTGNSLFGQPPSGEVVPYSLLKRIILEKRSVSEILAALPDEPFDNGCILLGDATGHLVCLEFMAGRRHIRDNSAAAYGHANSILTEEFRPFEPVSPVSPSSPVRQRNIQRGLDARRGRLTAAELKRLFADHTDYPLCVCSHRLAPGQSSTTASFIANLTDREIEIAIGNPCTAPYRRYLFA